MYNNYGNIDDISIEDKQNHNIDLFSGVREDEDEETASLLGHMNNEKILDPKHFSQQQKLKWLGIEEEGEPDEDKFQDQFI